MHYFPSTYDELAAAILRRRYEITRDGRDPDALQCVWGRLQRTQFEATVKQRCIYQLTVDTVAQGNETRMQFMGVAVIFDDHAPWRFEFV